MRIGLPTALHALGQATRLRPMAEFARAADAPEATQLAKLREMLARNAGTEYGRRYGFAAIRTARDYAERVPIVTPSDVAPYVERTMRGERDVLTADPPVYYTRTTGTGGAVKHVPITDSYRADFQRTVHVALGHLYRRFPAAFLGRALYFVGSRRMDRAADGNDVGTMSGYNFTELPPLLRKIYAWPYELFEVGDLATRSYLSLALALVSDVSLVAGIFPAPIVYLLRDLETRAPELARDLRDGALSSSLALTSEQRAFFEARLGKKRPAIAARLDRAMRARPEDFVSAALPMLRLGYCWTTSTAALYVPELRRRLGPRVAVRDAIYSATEAWCTIPMGEEEPGGPFALSSGYYEFVEEGAFERGSRDTVGVHALEDGKRYAIVITTATGLYRYSLGDVIEVHGKYRATPRAFFVRRAGATSSVVGEKLDEVHVTGAVSEALAALGLEATWFTLAPEVGAMPRYLLRAELARGGDLDALAARADEALRRHAFDYGRLRTAGQLAPMIARAVAPGAYHAYRQERLRGGAAEAQLKTAHLVADASAIPEALRG